MNVVDHISFRSMEIDVYGDGVYDDAYFKLKDFATVQDLECIEHDEWKKIDGEIFVTEIGLYNLLAHMGTDEARIWRRVIFEKLRDQRLLNKLSMGEQFDDWENEASQYYIDEETGQLMKSVTVEGGDVIQVPA